MKRVWTEIGGGDAGIDKIVGKMTQLAVRDSRDAKIIAIAKTLKRATALETIRAIHAHVWKTVKYVSDPQKFELVAAPIYTLTGKRPYGDCDCQATAAAALALALGIESAFKVIAWRPETPTEFTHVYNLFFVPELNVWIPVDTVNKAEGFGWEKSPVNRTKIYKING